MRTEKGREALVSELREPAHLFQVVGVEKNPTKLDELGRVLRNVDTVFIASSRNMDDDVSVDFQRGNLGGSHGDGHWFAFGSRKLR